MQTHADWLLTFTDYGNIKVIKQAVIVQFSSI